MSKNQLKYMELVNWLKNQINTGVLKPGQKMYSENKLTDMFQISRQTVRHAISLLEEEGLLTRVQGSGTYIKDRRRNSLKDRTRIAVITTYVDGYIFPKTIQGIENELSEHGYSVLIAFTNNQNSREKTILEDILAKDEVAGIIVETTKSGIPNPNIELYHQLHEKDIPIIFINSYYPQLDIAHVSLNDKEAGRIGTDYLIEMGHKDIGGIFKMDDGQGHLRYAGYLTAMNENELTVDDARIVWIDTHDMKHPGKCRSRYIDRLKECTAVFCYNDQVAYDFIEIMKEEGKKVPEDISIVSVDDSELAMLGDVPITSIVHPMSRLGEKAATNLISMIHNPSFDGTYEFEAAISNRDSVININK